MASGTMSIAPKRYRRYNSATYYTYNAGDAVTFYNNYALFEFDFGESVTQLSDIHFRFHVDWTATSSFQWSVFLYTHEPALNLVDYDSVVHFSLGTSGSKYLNIDGSSMSASGHKIWIALGKDTRFTSGTASFGADGCSATVDLPPSSATPISPKNTSFNPSDSIEFSWSVSGDYNSSELQYSTDNNTWRNLATISNTETSYSKSASSFSAGQIYWRVRVYSDVLGWSDWSSSVYFSVIYTTPTVTLIAPTSGIKNGGESISFNWSITSGSGSISGTQLQYSEDEGVTWSYLLDSTSQITQYTAIAGKFIAGKIIWRVRAKDSYAGWGSWKQANFNVQYNTATVSLIAPTSGTREGGEHIEFAWSLSEGSGSINGVQMQTSSDDGINWTTRLDVTTKRINFVADPATLPPGALKWRVRVKDSYAGWSDWKTASVTIKYSATSYVVPLNSPTGGNVNAAEPITFAGTLKANGTPYTPFTMAAATFFWRSRASDPYTEISMTPEGANASVVIPGGTFPSGSVYWYIEATDNTGASTQTDVYTISTLASKIDAAPVAPVGVIETKNTPTIFRWRYATVTGSEQKAAELEYSIDGGASWIELGSVQGEETSYTAAANALPSGTITWRVRAENAANEWGEWSAPVSFVNFGAPDVFSVLTDGKPYTTITWQVNTQESYKLFVDGVQIGPYHGEDVRSYTLTQPLADGQHTVQIQVQNEYSQWSPINETVFDVVNTPDASITLRHRTAVDAALMWNGGNGTGDYYVYRDGVPIAHTRKREYIDRVALGTHEYFVIEKLASGDYNRSNTVTATPGVMTPMIAPIAGGNWLPLSMSLNADRVIEISEEVRTAERFVLGADFPAVTIGRHRTKRANLDAAWLRSSIRNDAFMELLGKPVILKLPWGDVIVGVLPAYAQSNALFASGYTYSISQADWRDFIEDV